ncbi:MAG TPA: alpha/beta hydrolase [Streptosporangiaceae bacterium]|nr:alpha/beta hydrolase [Streptosporangiaceae bacterium]
MADHRPTVRPELAGIRTHQVFRDALSYFDVPYAVLPGFRALVLDLHVPARPDGDPAPVVVYAHGGGFFSGTRTMGPWAFLLEAGYAVASVDYRLSGECRFPGPVHDVAAAVRWVRVHADEYGLDAGRVAGFGSSAGGYLMNAVALASGYPEIVGGSGETAEPSCDLAAVIDHYAPVDFLHMDEDSGQNGTGPAPGPGSPLVQFLGFIPSAQPDEAERANLCRYVTAASPPFLIAHGDADGVVGVGQSRRLRDALAAAGARAELVVVPGAGHGSPEFDQPGMHDRALAFLESALIKPANVTA